MSDHGSIVGMGPGVVLQLREQRFDLSLYLIAAGARHARDNGRIKPPFQFH